MKVLGHLGRFIYSYCFKRFDWRKSWPIVLSVEELCIYEVFGFKYLWILPLWTIGWPFIGLFFAGLHRQEDDFLEGIRHCTFWYWIILLNPLLWIVFGLIYVCVLAT